jgi:hypothetical protein
MNLVITYSSWNVVRSYYKPLRLNLANRKRETVYRLLAHPSSSGISTTGKLEHSTGFSRTIRRRWGRIPDQILHHIRLSPRNGIGPRQHPYASFKVDYTKGVTKFKEKN